MLVLERSGLYVVESEYGGDSQSAANNRTEYRETFLLERTIGLAVVRLVYDKAIHSAMLASRGKLQPFGKPGVVDLGTMPSSDGTPGSAFLLPINANVHRSTALDIRAQAIFDEIESDLNKILPSGTQRSDLGALTVISFIASNEVMGYVGEPVAVTPAQQ